MFQALITSASRRVCNRIQHANSADRTLSSIIRGANCKLSKSTQSIFSNMYISNLQFRVADLKPSSRTNYHTSLFSQKSSKKKKVRSVNDTNTDENILEMGRYERNERGEWVRRVVQRKSSAVLSPELAADISQVLDQDIEGLTDEPVKDRSRDVSSVKQQKSTKTSVKTNKTKALKSKKKSKTVRNSDEEYTLTKEDKAVLAQYKDLVDESDFKPSTPQEIRAPVESPEDTERAVAQVVEWLKQEKMADLCAIDLRVKTDWSRFMVVATAMSERHNRAVAETVAHKLGQMRGKSYTVHSGGEDNWLIVTTGDMVIELFTEERRQFYDIERLWVLKRPIQEEMDIDPDDLVRFQFDEEDGMYDDEVRAKIAAERLARGEVVEQVEAVRESEEAVPVIPYSSRDADKKSKKKRK